MKNRERSWLMLLESLAKWTVDVSSFDTHLDVTVDLPNQEIRVVRILMTRAEWDEMVAIPFGDIDKAIEEVKRAIMSTSMNENYLIYVDYKLYPSANEFLPAGSADDWDDSHLQILARTQPEAFRWVARREGGDRTE